MRGLQEQKCALQGVFFHVVLVQYPWTLIRAMITAGTIHLNIRTACWEAMVKRGRMRGPREMKVLEKVGDISPWLQGVGMLRGEDSLAFEMPESPWLDASCQPLGLGPRQSSRSSLAFLLQNFTLSLEGHLQTAAFLASFWFFLCLAPCVSDAAGFAAMFFSSQFHLIPLPLQLL